MAEESAKPVVKLAVIDDGIVVVLPGTRYTVTYYKPNRTPQLIAKRISDRDDPGSDVRLAEFLAQAWIAANDKARELGWIV
jgi:hypothetical protein